MSTKNAILISLSEENEAICQYLSAELTLLDFAVKEQYTLENKSDITSHLEQSEKNCDVILVVGKSEVIFEAVSKVFDEELVISKHLASIYNLPTANIQKAIIPNSSLILQVQNHVNGINPVCIKYRNILVLPDDLNSIKIIFQSLIMPLLTTDGTNILFEKHFTLKCLQNGAGNFLNEELTNLNEAVNVRSFCAIKKSDCELNIVLSSANFSALVDCEILLKEKIPKNTIVNETVNYHFSNGLKLFENKECVQESINLVKKCYIEYNPDDIFLSFNGGKDCTALLYMTLHVLKQLYPEYKKPLLCLYIQSPNPFSEVEEFIDQCKKFYNLEVLTISSGIKAGLEQILKERTNLKACLMGTRRTDPYSEHLNHFQMTDPDWPQIMRVCPILDWDYTDVWDFLLKCNIPYCKLYDLGYTSLGSRTNTGPNPALGYSDENSKETKYLPAYKLLDGSKERNGRQKL